MAYAKRGRHDVFVPTEAQIKLFERKLEQICVSKTQNHSRPSNTSSDIIAATRPSEMSEDNSKYAGEKQFDRTVIWKPLFIFLSCHSLDSFRQSKASRRWNLSQSIARGSDDDEFASTVSFHDARLHALLHFPSMLTTTAYITDKRTVNKSHFH